MMTESALLSCEWLQRNLNAENQRILDATFFLPRQQRDARAEYQHHIPGALFFDIDQVADQYSPYAHMLPSTEQFSAMVGNMGIDNDTHVVIYDNNHFFAAARAWWMFRVFGHDKVKVLDGGLTRWKQLNLPLTAQEPTPERKTFNALYRSELVFNLQTMITAQTNRSRQIIDARSPDSFLGQRPLSDPGLQPGHIPGSINIPYSKLTDDKQQTLLSRKQIQVLFENAGINQQQPIVTTCGSGVSAAVLALALYQTGQIDVPVYDGSWAEWGRQPETPKDRIA